MKKKTILLLTLILFAGMSAYAKRHNDKLDNSKFGIEFGYDHNWQYAYTEFRISDYTDVSKKTINLDGFHVGPTYSYYFKGVKGLYLNGSLVYQYGVGKIERDMVYALTCGLSEIYSDQLDKMNKFSYITHSLELPIRIGYTYEFDNGLGINFYAGPLINIALDWKISASGNDGEGEMHLISGKMVYKQNDIETKKTDENFKTYNPFDVAIGGGVGVTYKGLYLNIGCDWGLTNVCKRPSYVAKVGDVVAEYSNKSKVTQLKLSIGYKF